MILEKSVKYIKKIRSDDKIGLEKLWMVKCIV